MTALLTGDEWVSSFSGYPLAHVQPCIMKEVFCTLKNCKSNKDQSPVVKPNDRSFFLRIQLLLFTILQSSLPAAGCPDRKRVQSASAITRLQRGTVSTLLRATRSLKVAEAKLVCITHQSYIVDLQVIVRSACDCLSADSMICCTNVIIVQIAALSKRALT